MTLTPSDVEQKTFSTALRGYNLDEVDDFLDEVVRTMRDLHKQLEEARSARPAPAAPVVPAPAPAPTPPPTAPPTPIDESAVGKALIAAQETAERILAQARLDASSLLDNAHTEADSFEEDREQRRNEAEREIARISALVERVKDDIAELSASVDHDVDDMSAVLGEARSHLDLASAGQESATTEDEGSSGPVVAPRANRPAHMAPVSGPSPGDEPDDTATEPAIVTAFYDQDDEYDFDDEDAEDEESEAEEEDGDSDEVDEAADDASDDDDDDGDEDSDDEDSDDEDSDDDDSDEDDDYFNYPDGDEDEEESTI